MLTPLRPRGKNKPCATATYISQTIVCKYSFRVIGGGEVDQLQNLGAQSETDWGASAKNKTYEVRPPTAYYRAEAQTASSEFYIQSRADISGDRLVFEFRDILIMRDFMFAGRRAVSRCLGLP